MGDTVSRVDRGCVINVCEVGVVTEERAGAGS
jgi:hypothetical protein